MPMIAYKDFNFRQASLRKIAQANAIIAEYQAQGFVLTLRQLYYQFVARDLIPNKPAEYDNLGALMTDARLAGMVDWDAIEDRTRNLRANPHWGTPADIVNSCAQQFQVHRWENMDHRPEVWIEKEALAGVFAGVCQELDVPYFSCRGYGSASEMWRAGQRMKQHLADGKTPIVFHFGDHDPSGIDMTRDITERLALFAEEKITVRRVALNMDQILAHDPPPNPAKVSDSRFEEYQALFGDESWELDALEPATLIQMLRDELEPLMDEKEWERTDRYQKQGRKALSRIAKNFKTAVAACPKFFDKKDPENGQRPLNSPKT